MRNLAIIPARSGSKGLPDKNIRLLCSKPMLAYSIEAAIESGMFAEIHLSTDSKNYAEIGKEYGANVPFLRNAVLATDMASSWDVALDVLRKYDEMGQYFDTVTLLQPTSPLRTACDIQAAFKIMRNKNAGAIVGVCESEHSPLWCNMLPEDGCMAGFVPDMASHPRQMLSTYYRINGAIYLVRAEVLRKKGKLVYDENCFAYVMPQNRSIDIDSIIDFIIAETLMKQYVNSGVG